MKYSQKVMDHFSNPRNVGHIEDPDGLGEVGNPACGDIMTFTIKVKKGLIDDVRFQTFGCGAAIAVSSMISEMAKGKTLEEALTITNKDVAEALDGLPANKLHCSNLGADALHAAIRNYYEQNQGEPGTARPKTSAKPSTKTEKHSCVCPYCNIENIGASELCKGCGKSLQEAS